MKAVNLIGFSSPVLQAACRVRERLQSFIPHTRRTYAANETPAQLKVAQALRAKVLLGTSKIVFKSGTKTSDPQRQRWEALTFISYGQVNILCWNTAKKCFSYLDFLSCFQPKYLKILKSRRIF